MELSGLDLTEFFEHNVRGTGELPPMTRFEFGVKMSSAQSAKWRKLGKLYPAGSRRSEGCLGVKYSKPASRTGAKYTGL